jgi:hypothetical protein
VVAREEAVGGGGGSGADFFALTDFLCGAATAWVEPSCAEENAFTSRSETSSDASSKRILVKADLEKTKISYFTDFTGLGGLDAGSA